MIKQSVGNPYFIRGDKVICTNIYTDLTFFIRILKVIKQQNYRRYRFKILYTNRENLLRNPNQDTSSWTANYKFRVYRSKKSKETFDAKLMARII